MPCSSNYYRTFQNEYADPRIVSCSVVHNPKKQIDREDLRPLNNR